MTSTSISANTLAAGATVVDTGTIHQPLRQDGRDVERQQVIILTSVVDARVDRVKVGTAPPVAAGVDHLTPWQYHNTTPMAKYG